MLRVFYSNRTERLFSAFARDVRQWRQDNGPLKPLRVVVPNSNVESWLKYELARSHGIAANIEVLHMMSLVRQLAEELGHEVLNGDLIRAGLLSFFASNDFADDPELLPLRRYLSGETRANLGGSLAGLAEGGVHFGALGGDSRSQRPDPDLPVLPTISGASKDLRLYQLASQLSGVFAEYTLSRPEMLDQWQERLVLQDTAAAETERWQRALWLKLWAPQGLLSSLPGSSSFPRADDLKLSQGPGPATPQTSKGESGGGTAAFQVEARFSESSEPPPSGMPALPLILPAQLVKRLATKDLEYGDIHIFGVSYVARVFHQLFEVLGSKSELRIYTLNPCQEYWEDVENTRPELPHYGRGSSKDESDDPFFLENPKDNPALRLWGRPGRENIHLLNELTQSNFESDFVEPLDPGNPSLLGALQQDILFRIEQREPKPEVDSIAGSELETEGKGPMLSFASSGSENISLHADGSISLMECAGIKREAEAIAGEIWRLVKEAEKGEGPPLRFNDIAVVVSPNEKEEYFTHLAAAFEEFYQLPFNLVDRSFSSASRVAEALELLIGLPEGNFTRPELLNLLSHPSIGGERVFGREHEQLVDWCARLGIFHGADRSDHAGTYIKDDRFNWDQGLRRMALAQFVTGSDDGVDEPVIFPEGEYLPEGEGAPLEFAALFNSLTRSLIGDARFASSARLTLSEWSQYFLRLLSAYIFHEEDEQDDRRALSECRLAMASLAQFDLDGSRFGYRVAAELAREMLQGISGGRGQYLASGVVLSTCQPMRALPFRVVFMAGMGESKFPSPARHDPLDLRHVRRQAGDVYPSQRDRYLFLETLLCARERLYLSWVAREASTGDPVEPSILITELEAILRGYLSEEEHAKLRMALPLRRYHPSFFPELFDRPRVTPAAAGEPLSVINSGNPGYGQPSQEVSWGAENRPFTPIDAGDNPDELYSRSYGATSAEGVEDAPVKARLSGAQASGNYLSTEDAGSSQLTTSSPSGTTQASSAPPFPSHGHTPSSASTGLQKQGSNEEPGAKNRTYSSSLSRRTPEQRFPLPLPKARSEAAALALRKRLEEGGYSGAQASWADLAQGLPSEKRETFESLLGFRQGQLHTDGGLENDELPEVLDVSISNLVAFLKCPLQGWARFRLGLREEEGSEEAALDGEPLVSPRLSRRTFLSSVFLSALKEGKPLNESILLEHYDRGNRLRQLQSQVPEGPFSEQERHQHLQVLLSWTELWDASPPLFGDLRQEKPVNIAVGRAPEFGHSDEVMPVLELRNVPIWRNGQMKHRSVHVHGMVKALLVKGNERLSLVFHDRAAGKIGRWVRWLEPIVHHAVLCAMGVEKAAHHLLSLDASLKKPPNETLSPIPADQARAWLISLISELFSRSHAYFFPCEAVLENLLSRRPLSQESLREIQQAERPSNSTSRGPVRAWREVPVPSEPEIERLLANRFEPLFSSISGGGK